MSSLKPIPGFEDCGFVSNDGRIFDSNMEPRKINIGRSGYSRVGFYGGKKTVNVHKLVAVAFCKGQEHGLQVNHKNGNKTDNRASNLEWATPSQNRSHAYKLGLQKPKCKLMPEQMPEVWLKRKQGRTYQSLAAEYGVSHSNVFRRLKKYEKGVVNCQP